MLTKACDEIMDPDKTYKFAIRKGTINIAIVQSHS